MRASFRQSAETLHLIPATTIAHPEPAFPDLLPFFLFSPPRSRATPQAFHRLFPPQSDLEPIATLLDRPVICK